MPPRAPVAGRRAWQGRVPRLVLATSPWRFGAWLGAQRGRQGAMRDLSWSEGWGGAGGLAKGREPGTLGLGGGGVRAVSMATLPPVLRERSERGRGAEPSRAAPAPALCRQLIPMIGFICLGMGSAGLYLLRLALRSPDVCWDRKNNPEPWNRMSPNDQYKFLAVSTDYKKLKKDRPDF
ncbi:NADH dehydrogenase [ubiquinone] 1 alpha subcomplex subunit 4-like 2 isoform X1 [Peromyscus californicus insignis]|uniref:NADH dehydrogenase [ubiquinone] 1 alpha subcomplex subunit 4-like 2 isoform X1 n=1 Tax=Peromyscus californicus insignis TaxID=564181 RepID=UPI0022A67E4D|nr:NADH dehydrogenase [ubiquinone] 1 alpha subcomplex subunit 4-like 2 isoform X1 [Peromyscus californicus insignis]